MRKITSYLLCLALCLGLAACAEGGEQTPDWQEQYDLGARYLGEGNYREAVIAFEAAIEIDPHRAEAYVGLADAYLALGDEDAARAAIDTAIGVCGEQDILTDWLAAHPKPEPEGPETPEEPETPAEPEAPEEPEIPAEPEEPEAPAWLLTGQTASIRGELFAERAYTYDGDGYITSLTETDYNVFNGTVTVSTTTWTYSEPGVAWYVPDRSHFDSDEAWQAAQKETTMKPGTSIGVMGSVNVIDAAAITNPLLNDHIREAALAADGRVDKELIDYSGSVWSYAQYTFDEHGNPVHIDTYGEDGTVVGTCDLTWAPGPGYSENP